MARSHLLHVEGQAEALQQRVEAATWTVISRLTLLQIPTTVRHLARPTMIAQALGDAAVTAVGKAGIAIQMRRLQHGTEIRTLLEKEKEARIAILMLHETGHRIAIRTRREIGHHIVIRMRRTVSVSEVAMAIVIRGARGAEVRTGTEDRGKAMAGGRGCRIGNETFTDDDFEDG